MPENERTDDEIDPPPFLGSWNRVYGAILVYLAGLIGILYSVTRLFRY